MMRLPLSLLDLLACSFGGVILLFFVTITTIQENQNKSDNETPNSVFHQGEAPFILVVSPKNQEEHLFENVYLTNWELKPESNLEVQKFMAQDYAVIVMTKAPDPQMVFTLNGVTAQAVIGFVFQDGSQIPVEKTVTSGSITFKSGDFCR